MSIYLVIDTQMLAGKFGTKFGEDDYILAALNIYLDIVSAWAAPALRSPRGRLPPPLPSALHLHDGHLGGEVVVGAVGQHSVAAPASPPWRFYVSRARPVAGGEAAGSAQPCQPRFLRLQTR